MSTRLLCTLPFLFAGSFLHGCAPAQPSGVATLSAAITAADPSIDDNVGQMTLTLSGPGLATVTQDLYHNPHSSQFQGLIQSIPAGTYDFHIDAYDTSVNPKKLIYTGDVNPVTILPGQNTPVDEVLVPVAANLPPKFQNVDPTITGLVASSNTIAPGQVLTLSVWAQPGQSGSAPLTYAWSAKSGDGSFDQASQQSSAAGPIVVHYTAPSMISGAQMPESLTVKVTDSKGNSASTTIGITVDPNATPGSATLDPIQIDHAPDVSAFVADKNPVNPGDTTVLTVTAKDPDGFPLQYIWTVANCTGSFTDPANAANSGAKITTVGPSASFLVAQVPQGGGTCSFQVEVDALSTMMINPPPPASLSNTATLGIPTGNGPQQSVDPIIDYTYQSASAIFAGDTVSFRVRAHEPAGQQDSLQVDWSGSGLNLQANPPSMTASGIEYSSTLTWPSGINFTGNVMVSAKVSEAHHPERSTTYLFTVSAATP